MVQIGEPLKAYFKEKGITQRQLAERLGVSQPYVNALLNGEKEFGKKQAKLFGEMFGISPVWLLTGEGEMLLSHIGHTQIGSSNKIDRSPINVGSGVELEQLRKENELLKERLKDKEEIIKLLKSKK